MKPNLSTSAPPPSTPVSTTTTSLSPVSTNNYSNPPHKTLYNPRERVLTPVGDRSLTVQSAAAECDINNILAQYRRTGIVTHVTQARASYEDLPDAVDYQQSMNVLMEAQSAFSGLPAKVRDHYGNDPLRLLQALQDPSQHEQLREFGILRALPAAASVVVAPAATPPAAS